MAWLVVACAGGGGAGGTLPVGTAPLLVYVAAPDSPPGFRGAAEAASTAAFEHARLTFNPDDAPASAVRIDLRLDYRNLTETEFETIWRATTILLLTLYPSTCGHRTYDLTATVTGPGGASRTYAQTDSTVSWLWLLQAPHCGETPTPEEIESATARMLAAIYEDMRRDRALDTIALGIRGPDGPLVRIFSNRAKELVERVARVERPFDRWALTDYARGPEDYLVDLDFDVRHGSFSIGRGYLAIATGGLSTLLGGLCTASTITLTANFIGPDPARTRGYAFSESVSTRATSGGGCVGVDEGTQPDAFTDLVHRLFEQIQDDELIAALAPHATVAPVPPLVRVDISGAASPVRLAMVKAMPFPRFVFGAPAGLAPSDYVLTVAMETAGGGRREPGTMGAYGSALVLGLTGMNLFCNPTTFILRARLSDSSGREVRNYELAREFGYVGEGDDHGCHDNEHSNPGAIDELMRELFQRMQDDGTLRMLSSSLATGGGESALRTGRGPSAAAPGTGVNQSDRRAADQ